MSILKNFVNPWESTEVTSTLALEQSALSDNILSQNPLLIFEDKDKRGFRKGRDLFDTIKNRINQELKKESEGIKNTRFRSSGNQ